MGSTLENRWPGKKTLDRRVSRALVPKILFRHHTPQISEVKNNLRRAVTQALEFSKTV